MTETMNLEQYRALKGRKRPNKFNARKVSSRGRTFDSKAEARRYEELLILEKAGKIAKLKTQPRFTLIDKQVHYGEKIQGATYTADFQYFDHEAGRLVVEDVKSEATAKKQDYVLRKKLFMQRYGDEYEFREVIR